MPEECRLAADRLCPEIASGRFWLFASDDTTTRQKINRLSLGFVERCLRPGARLDLLAVGKVFASDAVRN
jgi:hypothetical protein